MSNYAIKYLVIDTNHKFYPQVFKLRNEVLRIPIGLNLNEEDTTNDIENLVFIAINKQEQVIACLMSTQIDIHTAKFRQMAVKPSWQKQNIGSKLMCYAEKHSRTNGIKNIILHARKNAVNFYVKLNFKPKGYEFEEVGIPHLLMEKRISINE